MIPFLLKWIFNLDSNNRINSKNSLIKNQYSIINFANHNNVFENVLSQRVDDINPLLLNNIEYETLLFNNIKEIIQNKENYINLNDKLLVDNLLQNLKNNLIWTNNLNSKEQNILKALLGIDTKFNQLFYYWRDFYWLNQKTPNLKTKIEQEINKNLINLFDFLWRSDIVRNNIYSQKIFGNINEIYPTAKKVDLESLPTNYDLDFIKKDLVRFNGNKILYLDNNKNYLSTDINVIQQLDSSIIDKDSWVNYLSTNIGTINDAQKILNKLTNYMPNIYKIDFSSNKLDIYKYSYYFDVKTDPYLSNLQIYVTTLIFLILGINYLSIKVFKTKNYKNHEIN